MEVCAWSENLNLSHANELGVLPMSKEDLLKNSDQQNFFREFYNKLKFINMTRLVY